MWNLINVHTCDEKNSNCHFTKKQNWNKDPIRNCIPMSSKRAKYSPKSTLNYLHDLLWRHAYTHIHIHTQNISFGVNSSTVVSLLCLFNAFFSLCWFILKHFVQHYSQQAYSSFILWLLLLLWFSSINLLLFKSCDFQWKQFKLMQKRNN